MSHQNSSTKSSMLTAPQIRARKAVDSEALAPLVCLTAYTYPMAKQCAEVADIILVGDSLGMVLYGEDSTLSVSLEMISRHARAVTKGAPETFVVADMPFGSYQSSPEKAFENAAHLMAESGCQAVKLEGGAVMAETISYLCARGVPVMAHVGLLPQSVGTLGGYRAQGKTPEAAEQILKDAHAVADAGAFAVVVEAVYEPLARRITQEISIPTIGIGASPVCDGQILVTEDFLGMTDGTLPRFVKQYANVRDMIAAGLKSYASEVRERRFPTADHCYGMPKEETKGEEAKSADSSSQQPAPEQNLEKSLEQDLNKAS